MCTTTHTSHHTPNTAHRTLRTSGLLDGANNNELHLAPGIGVPRPYLPSAPSKTRQRGNPSFALPDEEESVAKGSGVGTPSPAAEVSAIATHPTIMMRIIGARTMQSELRQKRRSRIRFL